MLQNADSRNSIEIALGNIAIILVTDLREFLQALTLNFFICPLSLRMRQRYAQRMNTTFGGIADHSAPTAADIKKTIALFQPQFIKH